MDPIARFNEYAATFEKVFESDDWSLLEPFFAEDVVYELTGAPLFAARHAGRDAVFAALKVSLDNFDRRFATRQLEFLEGPRLRDGAVWMRWRGDYSGPGLPNLVIDGQESAWLENDRIVRLLDFIPLEMGHLAQYWFEQYGNRLPPAPA